MAQLLLKKMIYPLHEVQEVVWLETRLIAIPCPRVRAAAAPLTSGSSTSENPKLIAFVITDKTACRSSTFRGK